MEGWKNSSGKEGKNLHFYSLISGFQIYHRRGGGRGGGVKQSSDCKKTVKFNQLETEKDSLRIMRKSSGEICKSARNLHDATCPATIQQRLSYMILHSAAQLENF